MTTIEALIGRTLEREQRAGIPHFRTGQLGARRIDPAEPDVVELSFVDGMGHAWLVCCCRLGGEWAPAFAFRGGQTFVREAKPPLLDGKLLDAVRAAR